jgi:hypothetical protein
MATNGVSTSLLSDAAIKNVAYDAFTVEDQATKPRWKSMGFESIKTDHPYREFSSMAEIGNADIKEEFQQIAIDTPKQGYEHRITPRPRAIMVPISEEMWRFLKRNNAGEIGKLVDLSGMVARSLKRTKETSAADLFANAFSTTDGLHPDGQPLISASHKLIRGGTASNSLGAVSISQESLEAMFIQGRKMPDDINAPAGIGDGKKKLIVQEDVTFDLDRILNSTLQSDNANNAKNTMKGKDIEVVPNSYLASTTNWFVVTTGVPKSIMYVYETESEMRDFGDDKTRTKFVSGYCNYEFGFFNWRGVQGSSF